MCENHVFERSIPLQLLETLVRRQKVVFEVEVRQVVAIEKIWGELLQAAAGQIDGVDPLGHHLN